MGTCASKRKRDPLSIDVTSNHRHDRFETHIECCGTILPCNTMLACVAASLVVATVCVVVTATIVSDNIHFCSSSAQCASMATTCQVASCRGICVMDPKPNCCESDDHCPSGECYTSICGADNTCKHMNYPDNTGCNDYDNCTFPDRCHAGACIGKALSRPCQMCVGGAFQPDPSLENAHCSDGNLCTEHDRCSNGVCSGSERVCPSETCKRGVCRADTGCGFENLNQNLLNDGCKVEKCVDGVLVESQLHTCQDNNPCTIDICVGGSQGASCYTGRTVVDDGVSYSICNGTCQSNDDCRSKGTFEEYTCWDGSCLPTDSDLVVRMSHGELHYASCPDNEARLEMRFFMDSDVVEGHMYVPLESSIRPIFPSTLTVKDIETTYFQNEQQIRTFFTVTTDCRSLVPDCFPFINGEYELRVTRYPCTNVFATHCELDSPSMSFMMVPFSVYSCPLGAVQLLGVLPELHVGKEGYTVTGVLSDENDKKMWLTDVTVCVPNAKGMSACVSNDAEYCPYRGCFDTPDEYLLMRVTFLSDSSLTSAVTTSSNRYHVDIPGYSEFDGDRCVGTPMNTIEFSLLPMVELGYEGRQAVLDVKYISPLCGNRRLSQESLRKVNSVTI